MSRIKAGRVLSFALAALLFLHPVVRAAEPQDIIDADQLTPQQVTYQTTAVERGSLIKETSTTASKYYPLTYHVRFEQDNAKFVEYTVKNGDTVQAGDVLARFTVASSDATLARLELNLQRTREQTAEGIREREREIARKYAEIAEASDEYEKEILELSVERMETELKQYRHRQQYSIDQHSKAYNEECTRRTTNVLRSPVDGVVDDLTYKMVDDAVSPYETLVTISSGDVMLLAVRNDSGGLRYNMPVEVQTGTNRDPALLTGRVVAADDAIPEAEQTGYAFIQLDPYDEEAYTINTPKVTAQSVRLDNVLLISKKAVTMETDKKYVTKLTDGMVQKRYIESAISNNESIWVLAGVEEGETLVLD